jgi:hypothetical protein
MANFTQTEIWTVILAVASAIVLLSNAAEKIAKAWRVARAPMSDLEEWRKGVDQKLDSDKKRLDGLDEGNRATQRAILALLDHGIDGNNIEQMKHAKEELQNHLINR